MLFCNKDVKHKWDKYEIVLLTSRHNHVFNKKEILLVNVCNVIVE